MTTSQRGLTILETLLATALLAVIATTCTRVLVAAMGSSPIEAGESLPQETLEAIADSLLAPPRGQGQDHAHDTLNGAGTDGIRWTHDTGDPLVEVTIRRLTSPEASPSSLEWIVVTSGPRHAFRIIRAPRREASP